MADIETRYLGKKRTQRTVDGDKKNKNNRHDTRDEGSPKALTSRQAHMIITPLQYTRPDTTPALEVIR